MFERDPTHFSAAIGAEDQCRARIKTFDEPQSQRNPGIAIVKVVIEQPQRMHRTGGDQRLRLHPVRDRVHAAMPAFEDAPQGRQRLWIVVDDQVDRGATEVLEQLGGARRGAASIGGRAEALGE